MKSLKSLPVEYRDQELEAHATLANGDPKAICDLGWRRVGEARGTPIYRIAGPFLYESRTVKTLGKLEPWT